MASPKKSKPIIMYSSSSKMTVVLLFAVSVVTFSTRLNLISHSLFLSPPFPARSFVASLIL